MIPVLSDFGKPVLLLYVVQMCFLPLAAGQAIDFDIRQDHQYTSYVLDKEQGLRGNIIQDLIQDQKGYIWVVTNGWVQRYNGHQFETFFKIIDPQNFSVRLREDEEGKIWVFKYSRKNYPFIHLAIADIWVLVPETQAVLDWETISLEKNLEFPKTSISGIGKSEPDGAILFGLADGRVFASNGGAKIVSTFPGKEPIFQIATNQSGVLCMSSANKLILQDSTGVQLAFYDLEKPVARLTLDEDSGVLFRFLGENESFSYIPLFGKPRSFFAPFSLDLSQLSNDDADLTIKNDRYLISENGIYETGSSQPLITSKNCQGFYMDRQQNLWTGNRNGISVLRLSPKRFTTLLAGQDVETRGILPLDDSLLLVHSFKGTFLVDLKRHILDFNPQMTAGIGLVKDKSGRIWEGVYGSELAYIPNYRKNLASQKIRDTTIVGVDNYVISPYFTHDHVLWLGKKEGLWYCQTPKAGLPENSTPMPDLFLQKTAVHYLEEINGILWAATGAGLFEIDPIRHRVIKHHEQLKNLNINHFSVDGQTVWLSTFYSGLIKWEYGAPEYHQILLAEEGPYMEIPSLCGVYDDGFGFLWLPTNLGLYRFRKADETYQCYDKRQHISHEEFNYYSHTRLPDGRFAFGGLDGITLVDPTLTNVLDRQQPTFSLELTNGVICRYHHDRNIEIRNGVPITLLGQEENLQFDCSLLDFRSGQKGKIMYLLEGIHADWQPLEGKTLRLERLPFGHYMLKIKALSFDNLSNGNEWEIPIYAKKPLYLTSWFIGAFILLVFTGGAGIVTYRFRSERKTKLYFEELVKKRTAELEANKNFILTQNKELNLLNDYKNKIMAIIGHDMRGPILGLSKMGQKMQFMLAGGDTDRIIAICRQSEKQIDHLRILIDNVLAWSLVQSKSSVAFNRKLISLEEIVIDQLKLLQPESDEKSQEVILKTKRDKFFYTQDFLLSVLIRNLLANSIRYSDKGSFIKIKITQFNGAPCLKITDMGPGMPASLMAALNQGVEMKTPFTPEGEEGLGLGLWICSALLQNLQGKWFFAINKAAGFGLKVKLWFPTEAQNAKDSSKNLVNQLEKNG